MMPNGTWRLFDRTKRCDEYDLVIDITSYILDLAVHLLFHACMHRVQDWLSVDPF